MYNSDYLMEHSHISDCGKAREPRNPFEKPHLALDLNRCYLSALQFKEQLQLIRCGAALDGFD